MTFRKFICILLPACLFQSATYGLTFLLPDLFAQIGGTAADVGTTLGVAALTTLSVVLFLGEVTKRAGVMVPLSVSGILCATSLALFASATSMGLLVLVAGALLGLGWGLFYVLGPIVLAQVLRPDQRVTYFTWLSAFVMAGIGMGPISGYILGVTSAFYTVSVLCLVCGAAFGWIAPALDRLRVGQADVENDLSLRNALRVMRSPAWRPIVMVGLGASVFAALSNFQTIYADKAGLSYAVFFLVYTVTVIAGRFAMAHLIGTRAPYGVIAILMGVMTVSVLVFLAQSSNTFVYLIASGLFGIGYGIAYPIVKAMAANDAWPGMTAATLQMFGLAYFIGVFGFPFVAGGLIERHGVSGLLILAAMLSAMEGCLAFSRWRQDSTNAHGRKPDRRS